MNLSDLGQDERAEWDTLITEALAEYTAMREQRYVMYRDKEQASRWDYQTLAQRAYIRWGEVNGQPRIDVWPDRQGAAAGVMVDFRTGYHSMLTADGVRAICAVMTGEAPKRRRSVGYGWGLAAHGLYVAHTPRASLAPLVRALWPILTAMSQPHDWGSVKRVDRERRNAVDAEITAQLATYRAALGNGGAQ